MNELHCTESLGDEKDDVFKKPMPISNRKFQKKQTQLAAQSLGKLLSQPDVLNKSLPIPNLTQIEKNQDDSKRRKLNTTVSNS